MECDASYSEKTTQQVIINIEFVPPKVSLDGDLLHSTEDPVSTNSFGTFILEASTREATSYPVEGKNHTTDPRSSII